MRMKKTWKEVCGLSTQAHQVEYTTTIRRMECHSGRGLLACQRGIYTYVYVLFGDFFNLFRTKTDESHSKRITPSSKHSSHPHASSSTHSHSSHSHPHSGSSSTSSTAHLHSHTSSSHTHGNNKEFMSSSHHRSLTHHTIHSSSQTYLDRVREKEQRDRSRTSHQRSNRGSRSSSKSTSVSPTTGSRGHGHHDKTTPNRHSRTHASSGSNKRGSLSPNVTPNKPSQTGSSTVSPGIPHDISQVSIICARNIQN